jgi:hypothetical protein
MSEGIAMREEPRTGDPLGDEPLLFSVTGSVGYEIQCPPDPPEIAEDPSAGADQTLPRFLGAIQNAFTDAGHPNTSEAARGTCAGNLAGWWGALHRCHPPVEGNVEARIAYYLQQASTG